LKQKRAEKKNKPIDKGSKRKKKGSSGEKRRRGEGSCVKKKKNGGRQGEMAKAQDWEKSPTKNTCLPPYGNPFNIVTRLLGNKLHDSEPGLLGAPGGGKGQKFSRSPAQKGAGGGNAGGRSNAPQHPRFCITKTQRKKGNTRVTTQPIKRGAMGVENGLVARILQMGKMGGKKKKTRIKVSLKEKPPG